MVRYLYNQNHRPPAPFVHVTLRDPDGKVELAELPAQIDPAADRTIIPIEVVEQIGLLPLDDISLVGLGGKITSYRTHLVSLAIRRCEAHMIEVAAYNGEPWILLGRDVLNQFRVVLDGPALALEVG